MYSLKTNRKNDRMKGVPADEIEGQVEGWINSVINLYPVTGNNRCNTVDTKQLLKISNVLLSTISTLMVIHIYDSHQNMFKKTKDFCIKDANY